MSLYAIGQRVWCKSQDSLAVIREANYTPKAAYLVGPWEGPGNDLLTGSRDLRAADWCCDGCGRWLPGRPYRTGRDGEYPDGLGFCFLCVEIYST